MQKKINCYPKVYSTQESQGSLMQQKINCYPKVYSTQEGTGQINATEN